MDEKSESSRKPAARSTRSGARLESPAGRLDLPPSPVEVTASLAARSRPASEEVHPVRYPRRNVRAWRGFAQDDFAFWPVLQDLGNDDLWATMDVFRLDGGSSG